MSFTLNGIGASTGLSIGQAFWWKKEITIKEITVTQPDQEIQRLETAILITQEQIKDLRQLTVTRIGEQEAGIFDAHLSFLEDPSFTGEMKARIKNNKKNAEAMCEAVVKEMYTLFQSLDDDYMRARAEDIRDVGNRLLENMGNHGDEITDSIPPNTIIIAVDLTPSDTVQFSRDIKGIVTTKGSKNSHAAILARTLGIPAVFGVQQATDRIKNGDVICIDGENGTIYINPSPLGEKAFKQRIQEHQLHKEQSLQKAAENTYTIDGKRVHIFANIGHPRDIETALSNHAEGVGLFRSEFLYLESEQWPTEEEQYLVYQQVLTAFSPKPVIIRTLDIGGDKQIPYAKLPVEENPYLGCRGIRYCLENKETFKIQLRSLLKASMFGNLWILLPMISDLDQVRETKRILEECKKELSREGVPFAGVKIGVMIEVPAAALIADDLTKEVDFFSIGTNDLTQYTLAADRGNEHVGHLYDETHLAVMRLIQMVCDAAKQERIPVGICGELASNLETIEKLVQMGIEEFSVTPHAIPKVKEVVRKSTSPYITNR